MTPSLVIAVDCRPLIDKRVSGVSVYTREIINELKKEPSVSLSFFYQNGKRIEHLHQEFEDIEFIQASSSLFHMMASLKTTRLAANYFKKKPDLIWLPDRRPFYKTEIPVVMTIHDMVPKYAPRSLSWKSKLWHGLFPTRRLLKNIDGVLCPSFTVEQEIPRTMPRRVTYEGARASKTSKVNGIPKDFVLFIAPNDPRKGIENFLRLVSDFPKENFVWAGKKSNDHRFSSKKAKSYPNLRVIESFTNAEKWWLLRNAKALLAISEYEGFDLPALEAVHAKCPVILSDIDVHRELYSGANFVSNYEELKTEFLRARTGKLSLAKARGSYTWKSAAERSLLFFRRVIENKDR